MEEAARLREPLIIDAEVVHLSAKGVADFDALHSRDADGKAVACAFDLLIAGDDIRRRPLFERKATLKWVLRRSHGGIQYVDHTQGDGEEMFAAVCKLGLEGMVSKRLTSIYRSGPQSPVVGPKSPQQPRRRQNVLTEVHCCYFAGRRPAGVRADSKSERCENHQGGRAKGLQNYQWQQDQKPDLL